MKKHDNLKRINHLVVGKKNTYNLGDIKMPTKFDAASTSEETIGAGTDFKAGIIVADTQIKTNGKPFKMNTNYNGSQMHIEASTVNASVIDGPAYIKADKVDAVKIGEGVIICAPSNDDVNVRIGKKPEVVSEDMFNILLSVSTFANSK